MALMTRKTLLVKQELTVEKVDLDGGDFVFVREMTGREKDRWEQSLGEWLPQEEGQPDKYVRSLDDFRAKLAVNTVCDEKGNLLLEPSDIATLSQNMGFRRLAKIVDKAQELNKVSEAEKKALVKN